MSNTYLLVDGENIDRTLGQILDRKPRPSERPRWERIREYVDEQFGESSRALFFLNASRGLPGSFIQALRGAGFLPIPLTGPDDVKVVDEGINKTLAAISKGKPDASVALASHDADFLDGLRSVDMACSGKTAVVCFEEYLAGSFVEEIPELQIFDLEFGAKAFDCAPLPRIRVIDIEEFDPVQFL